MSQHKRPLSSPNQPSRSLQPSHKKPLLEPPLTNSNSTYKNSNFDQKTATTANNSSSNKEDSILGPRIDPSQFPSYKDVPNLAPKIKLLCEILSTTPAASLESTLSDTGIPITSQVVEEVLKLSYSTPVPAVKFFRWAGQRIPPSDRLSPYSWNLVIDLLGRNQLFDAMWNAVKSMRAERLLSLATFASVFASYAAAGRPHDAYLAFQVMDQYGCPRDVAALNSLLSAVCRHSSAAHARLLFPRARSSVPPDADTFAILLEAAEAESDASAAHTTFDDLVATLGWNPLNVPAYDSFLSTLLSSSVADALKQFDILREHRCSPGPKFFRSALELLVRSGDDRTAASLWSNMISRSRFRPDTHLYNLMISLHCDFDRSDAALRLLDHMVLDDGAFPNSDTYNILLRYFVKKRRLRDSSMLFKEMVKNDCLPTNANCFDAIRFFLVTRDPEMAIKTWRCMVENNIGPLEETANYLVSELPHHFRLPEAVKYAEDMIERGIKLNSSTLTKLKQNLMKAGKGPVYEDILKKWKSRSAACEA